jgi:hypothetical protein
MAPDLIPVRPPMPDTVRPDGGCPEAADGQSADRSGSSKTRLLLSRPALRVPSRTVTDADVAVCSRGSWSAHANAMGPGYLYCARRGFASDDVCTLPMVSCSVDPSRRANRDSRERDYGVVLLGGVWEQRPAKTRPKSRSCRGRHGQLWFASPACDPEPPCGRRGPGTPQPRAGPSGSGHAPEVAAQ